MRIKEIVGLAVLLMVMLLLSSKPVFSATIPVTISEDSGAGTLRQALLDAANGDSIEINVSNSITVYSSLPVNVRVGIDGNGTTLGANGSFPVLEFNAAASSSLIQNMAIVDGNAGLYLSSADNVEIYNCRIGTDWADSTGRGNIIGIQLLNCSGVVVGAAGYGNVISCNTGFGMYIAGSSNITIQGNMVGTDAAGSVGLGAQPQGIYFYTNDSDCLVGGDRSVGEHNVVSGNSSSGIVVGTGIGTMTNITVAGNIVGLNATQTGSIANGTGIYVNGGTTTGCTIGLNEANKGNILCSNTYGLRLQNAYGNTVQNNLIGINESGAVYTNLNSGIDSNGGMSNLIGGTSNPSDYERNVISGQSGSNDEAIYLYGGASGNTISGNYIGTNIAGDGATANYAGIFINDGDNNLIGGPRTSLATSRGNIIAGNSQRGIIISNGDGNAIMGNTIGLTYNEDGVLGQSNGIWLSGANVTNTLIGTGSSDMANVIAGNGQYQLRINAGASGTIVRGNYIGFTRDGLTQYTAGLDTIDMDGTSNNWIGGTTLAEGNLIDGGCIIENGSTGNTIAANRIGVCSDLSTPSVTWNFGIRINDSTGNFIGLPNGGIGNLIANQYRNIDVNGVDADYNGFFANTITAAGSVPIDLEAGANEGKVAPTINSAYVSAVSGTSGANDYIELYQAESGAGNGGSLNFQGYTTADGSGNWSITPSGLSIGDYVCAIATDSDNNSSNFSTNATVVEIPTATPTSTQTLTFTPTSTYTSTIAPTNTATLTNSPTPTITPTSTMSPTITLTPTETPVLTRTPPATITSTFTPTMTASPTVTVTPDNPLLNVDLKGKTVLAYPNPGTNEIRFLMHLDQARDVSIQIYNMAGERVTTLAESLAAGHGQVMAWDCRDVAVGIYIAKVFMDGTEKQTLKVVIVH